MLPQPIAAVSMALLSLSAATAAHAQVHATVVIEADAPPRYPAPAAIAVQYTAPPAPLYEVVPAPRPGMVWVPGHWEWRGHRHVWMAGYWLQARPGYRYREPLWVERGGRWYLQPGGWDRDGDGIPNRYDKDRDGDGVPNRYDRRPDNPRRY